MYQSLQACRAVAALLVLMFHLGGTFASPKYFADPFFDRLFGWGDSGAALFFVLSGFIITKTHRRDIGQPQRLASYVRRRLTRIYPTYWFIFIVVYVASLAIPRLQVVPTDASTVLKSLLLLPQDPAVVGGTGAPVLFVAWTLQYEMLFYAVMACFISSRVVGGVVLATLLGLQFACNVSTHCGFPFSFLSSHLIWLFGFGVLAAWNLERGWFRFSSPRLAAALAGLVMATFGLATISWFPKPFAVDPPLVYGALSALIVMALVQAEKAGAFVSRRSGVALLGDASYALYLVHIPVISICVKVFVSLGVHRGWSSFMAFVVTALACVAVACLFHRLIEAPLLRWFAAGNTRREQRQSALSNLELPG